MSHARNTTCLENGVIDVDFYHRQSGALRRSAMRDAHKPKAPAFRIAVSTLALGLAVAAAISAPKALAQAGDGHTILAPSDIKWSPAPPSIPAGAQAAVLYGDPGKDGP